MHNRDDKDWTKRDPATYFSFWIILWLLIALVMLTFLSAFTHGDQKARDIVKSNGQENFRIDGNDWPALIKSGQRGGLF